MADVSFEEVDKIYDNGVQAVFDVLAELGRDSRAFGACRIAAIGPKTADALAARGLRADAVPSEYRGEEVAEAMLAREPLQGKRVLLARAELAREALPERLRALGAELDVVAAYRTVRAEAAQLNDVADKLRRGLVDVVTFTSSSTAEHLVAGLGDEAVPLLRGVVRAAIGPITADTLTRLGVPAQVVASEYTAAGLLAALTLHYVQPAGEPPRSADSRA